MQQGISNPSDAEKQAEAWATVIPLVVKLKEFYEFSKDLRKYLLCYNEKLLLTIALTVTVYLKKIC